MPTRPSPLIENLNGEERQSFEQRFLITEERREKVGFARELRAYAVRERQGASRSGARFALPSWASAAAAAVLVVVLPAATWQIARSGAGRDDVSAWLSAGQLRGVGSPLDRLRVPPEARLVRLRLELDAAKYPAYRATVHLVAGDELWSQSNLRPTTIDDRLGVELTLPAPMLTGDDYFIRRMGWRRGRTPCRSVASTCECCATASERHRRPTIPPDSRRSPVFTGFSCQPRLGTIEAWTV